ncbi:MAG: oligosaccharide flippase family protein [Bacteroidales bacterium]|jgi:O-antigen/teichoic acid export membrane protein|nr:oligosaccharide flippase family protein [Bacteroidales bacterium]
MSEDSVKKRYLFKLLTNVINLPITFVSQAIIPRILGASAYGSFSFLSGFFTNVISFLDSGTSEGFYTKLSQRQSEEKLVKFYLQFAFSVLIIFLIVVSSLIISNVNQLLWPDQYIKYVYMGLFWSWLTWCMQIVQKIFDAKGLTRYGEVVKIIQRFVGLLILVIFYFVSSISLEVFFYYHYFILSFYIITCTILISRKKFSIYSAKKISREDYKNYIKEFYYYSAPLLVYSLFNLLAGILDRWLIQKFYGSVEQGYFGLAYQVSAVCFIFSSSMTPIFTREISVAYCNKDEAKMVDLFNKYIPVLYFVAAFLSIFVATNSKLVVLLMGGEEYKNAFVVISIMALYPLHQTYGQLCGAVYYAMGKTKMFRNIGIIVASIGIPLAYFMIAPKEYFGLDLKANGLAIKMIAIQFIYVNILLYFISKLIKISFFKLFYHQIYSVVPLFLIAFIIKRVFSCIEIHFFLKLLISGIIYFVLVLILIYLFPGIISLKRGEINSRVKSYLRRHN